MTTQSDGPLGDGASYASDVKPLEEELAKIEQNPEWGMGPGTEYHANVQAALREALADAARNEEQPKDWRP